ncbi:MAG: hypothetical protein H7067_11145 [Burkholderiales bacterium]|nr:hypothetical protein [Opitutaceae bacterium]
MQLRPATLAEVAGRADSLGRFGRELADWLHTLRGLGSRPALVAAMREEPVRLAERFAEGALADATLAAYADFLAERIGVAPPPGVFEAGRIAPESWFAVNGPHSRLLALRDTPPAFKRRNLFTPAPDLPVRLRAGRPPVSAEARRAANAERQRRFQQRRRELVRRLTAPPRKS